MEQFENITFTTTEEQQALIEKAKQMRRDARKAYYWKDHEQILAKQRAYYKKNREKLLAYKRKWAAEHKDKVEEYLARHWMKKVKEAEQAQAGESQQDDAIG